MTSATAPRVLALDFDGVVVDALLECAAVTFFAGLDRDWSPESLPRLPEALDCVPQQYVDRFSELRPFCRTVADFMVLNHVDQRFDSRDDYLRAREAIDDAVLDRDAARGETCRRIWRERDTTSWLESHTLEPVVLEAIRRWPGQCWIVSAKDAVSISDILAHHGVRSLVDRIEGSCTSKTPALNRASAYGPVTFVDDNVEHVIAATQLTHTTAVWASWGYHAPGDADRCARAGVQAADPADLIHDQRRAS